MRMVWPYHEARIRACILAGVDRDAMAERYGVVIGTVDHWRRRVVGKKFDRGPPWTPEMDRALSDAIRAGHTSSQAAADLGRSRCAVLGRAYRLGWRFGDPSSVLSVTDPAMSRILDRRAA